MGTSMKVLSNVIYKMAPTMAFKYKCIIDEGIFPDLLKYSKIFSVSPVMVKTQIILDQFLFCQHSVKNLKS